MNDRDVVARAVEVLTGLGIRVVGRSGESVTVDAGTGARRVYRLVVRDRMTAPAAAAIEAGAGDLLVVPFVPEPAAAVLRERGLDYVDGAGNALLRGEGVLIDVRGRRPARATAPVAGPSAGRPFTRSGAQVTFCLLAWPGLCAASVREIAGVSGTAVGTVQAVLRDLRSGRYLIEAASGRRLVRGGELLTRWVEAYALSLSVSLHLGSYRSQDPRWWVDARRELVEAGVDLGGEAAAAVLDEHLRPEGALLYADGVPARVLARHRCRRVEDPAEANVIVRRRFWTVPTGSAVAERNPMDREGLVPSVLVYADLLVSGESRQREHAERLRSRDARLEQLGRT